MSTQEAQIIKASDGIAVYNEFRAQLAELDATNSKLVFNYEDPKGNKDARSHIYKLRQTKALVDKAREKEKRASLEYGRRVDAEAKEIIEKIDSMISVHAVPLDEIEQREKSRIAKHEQNLSEIVTAGEYTSSNWMSIPLDAIRDRLAEINAITLTQDYWQEFLPRAAEAKDKTLSQIRDAIGKRAKYDEEQAELERLRKEAEERARKDREEQIRREAEQKALADAEARARAERERTEAAAKAEREAAERRELELKLAAERAEREKVEAQQRAERAAKEAEERLLREQEEAKRKEAEAAAKREADKKHRAKINNAAVSAFVAGGMSEEAAKLAVTLIAKASIPAVSISY